MVSLGDYVPDKGHVVWIDLSPQTGHEQMGPKPALVLSPAAYNGKVGLCILCPTTNQVKGYPFEVAIPGWLPVTGVILADQVKSLDWRARSADYICDLAQETISEALAKLGTLLTP